MFNSRFSILIRGTGARGETMIHLNRYFLILILLAVGFSARAQNRFNSNPALEAQAKEFVAVLEKAPKLPRETISFPIQAPNAGWSVDIVSSVAVDSKGVIYALQRDDKADPIIAFDKTGKVIRSWGKGMYNIPQIGRA